MQRIRAMLRGEKGVTLIELMVVIAIIGILAAVVAGVTAGISATAKASSKDTDLKAVEDSAGRYETDIGSVPITGSAPTATLDPTADTTGSTVSQATLVVVIETVATPVDLPAAADIDVTCGSATATLAEAIAECFGAVDFSVLVPDYLVSEPAHAGATDLLGFTLVTGADLEITDVDRHGNDLEIWSDVAVTSSDAIGLWFLNSGKAYQMTDAGSY